MSLSSQTKTLKKHEFWFLQTHLTVTELNKVTNLLLFETKEKSLCLKKLLQKIISREERLKELLHSFSQKEGDNENLENVVTYSEISQLLQKNLAPNTALAFQFLGNINALKRPIVAIIGSRHPTYYGREQAHYFAKNLAKAGCTILSGGALGIDAIANATALGEGSSCAIIGSGIKNLYPASNKWLFQNLKTSPRGLILSEFSSYEPAQKWNFPRRNYSIAALADFVLIIEATLTSGSLITAHAAAEFGTDVGAVPGDINNINSEGTNTLIKNGAFCIQRAEDVLNIVK